MSKQLLTLDFADVRASVELKGGTTRQILRGAHGSVRQGELTMLMGASGAGKTTLFNTLSHRAQGLKTTGTVTLSGHPFDPAVYQAHAGYVTQDPLFVAEATVRETLLFQGRMKTGGDLTERVDHVLELLGLDEIQDEIVGVPGEKGSLSFAKLKLVNVAVALVDTPELLFVDEPTTGLDSTTAMMVVSRLQEVAHRLQIAVFCTVHQPSTRVLNLFDHVMIMAAGVIPFDGTVQELPQFLQRVRHPCPPHTNPADRIIELFADADPARVDELVKRAGMSEEASRRASPRVLALVDTRQRPSAVSKLWFLTVRSVKTTLRNANAFQTALGTAIMLSLLMGVLYWQLPRDQAGASDRQGLLFMLSANAFFLYFEATATGNIVERAAYIRESRDGLYNSVLYTTSKILALLPFHVLYAVLSASIVYPMSGMHSGFDRWLLFVCITLVSSMMSGIAGLAVGGFVSRVEMVGSISPLVGIPQMMFAGFLLSDENTPVYLAWLQNLSSIRYSFVAMLINEVDDLSFSCKPNEACPFPDGGAILRDGAGVPEDAEVTPYLMLMFAVGCIGLVCSFAAAWWAQRR